VQRSSGQEASAALRYGSQGFEHLFDGKDVVAVYLIARHMDGGTKSEHIAEVKWENRQSGATGQSTRAQMVDFIKNQKGDARVDNGASYVTVGVVDANPPYIRTFADGVPTDNLLELPTY
jgi:hypothetical protein